MTFPIRSRWVSLCLYAGIAAAALFLLVQHWIHLPAILPYALLAACPLMHIFMLGRHHHQPQDRGTPKKAAE